jgi:predicted RNA-binding Zn ribbon-like protein
MTLYAGNEGKLSKDLQIAVDAQGPEKAFEMLNFFTEFKDKTLAQRIYADIITKNPKQFDKIGKALAQLQAMDSKEINVEAFLGTKDANGKPIGAELLEKLANDLAIIEDLPDVTTKEAILKYFEQGAGKGMSGMDKAGLESLMSKWKNWDKLPDVAKKEAISKYKTIYETVFADEQARIDYAQRIARETANARSQGGRQTYLYEHVYRSTYETLMKGDANQQASNIAAAGSFEYVGEKGAIEAQVPGVDPNSSSTGTKVDPYANILKRLKEVRNAAIDATGGIKALNKALAEGNVTSVKNKYQGIEQQLQGKGYNQGFIDFIQGMDPKEQAKWMRTASKATKGKYKGQVVNPFSKKPAAKGKTPFKAGQVFLSQDAKSMAGGFDALVSGEFNTQADRQLKSLKYQEDAYNKLRAAGVDHLAAQKIISDEYLAQSISTGKLTVEEVTRNATLAKQIVLREKINGLLQSGRDKINEQNMFLSKSEDKVSKVAELLNFFKSKNINFGEGEIRNLLGDPETLSTLIGAMDEVTANTAGAAEEMDRLLAGVKALQANSDVNIAIKIATQTMTETVSQGAEAAKRINDVLTGMYSNLTASQLGNLTSFNPITKTKN